MIEASFGGSQYGCIFYLFDRFQFKKYPFFEIDTLNSSGLSKQNLPHFLTQFWMESPPDHSSLTALRKKEGMVMNGRFQFREEKLMIKAILLTLISRE